MTCWHRGGFTRYLIKRERISAEARLWAPFVIFADQSNDVGNCKCISKSADNESQNKSRSSEVGFCSEKNISGELKATTDEFQCWKRSKRCCPLWRHLLCLHLHTSAAVVREAGGHLSSNWFDIYLNPYCCSALMTITRIFLPAKVNMEIVRLVCSSTMHEACIFLDTFISRYLKTDFYEII